MSAFGGFGTTQQQQQQQQPQQQQQQQQPGGLFGFGSTNTTPATGSLFGTQQPAPTQSQFGATGTNQQVGGAGGGLFGSTTQQPSSGLFGNTNPAPTGGFGNAQTGAQSGGLFGNTPANGQTGSGGNPFNNAATATGASGGATGNSLFGNTGTSGQQASSGNSFGANPSTANIFGNGGAGTFGNTTTTTAPTGGLFGSTTAPAGGNPFGSTAASSTAGTTGGLFGSTTTAPGTTGNLFGSTLPNSSQLFGSTTQAPGASLFGNTQQQQQQSQPGLLFGSLGQQQKPATGGLFGSSTLGSNTLGASAIGGNSLLGSTNNLFSSKASSAPGLQQQDAQTQFAQLTQRIEAIAHSWNSNSPQCRFQHYFYNLVDPAQVHLYGRPPNAFNDALWEKAVRENPDPTWFVPVVATGFDDLQKRVEAQTQEAAAHQEKIKDLQARIAALTQRHQLSNASRLQRAAALQTQLTHRVLKLVKHLHLLIPALRSSALRPEEEALRTALEEIDEEVRRPGGSGRIRGKLNELWALVGAVTASRERGRGAGGVEWAVVNEEGLAQIAQIMAEEQAGLAHLTKLLQKDLKELAVIRGSSPQDDDQDSLMSSTATLRASTL